jgi:hypothetical protein
MGPLVIALLEDLGRVIYPAGFPEVTSDEHVRDWLEWTVRLATAILEHDAGSLLPR